MPYGCGPSLSHHNISSRFFRDASFVPILQVDDPLNPYLRNVVEVEQYVCNYGKNQQNCGCDHDQESVEICLSRRLGGRDSDWRENEILKARLSISS